MEKQIWSVSLLTFLVSAAFCIATRKLSPRNRWRTQPRVLHWASTMCKMCVGPFDTSKNLQLTVVFHSQQITVPVTKSFIEYLKTQPIMFKIFGHYQTHPLHKDAKQEFVSRPPPRRMLPPSIPISQPVRSPKFGPLPCPPSSTVLAKHDVLVWFEICELAPNGEYVPSVSPTIYLTVTHPFLNRSISVVAQVVEHSDDLPCRGLFLLHQGIQRRIRITIVHEPTPEVKWKDINELVVGRIRNTPESSDEQDEDACVLSLGLFPGEVLEVPGDDRSFYRFEAAWDSSLHNSALLNRVSQGGETIYITLSAYLEVSQNNFAIYLLPYCTLSPTAGELRSSGDHYQRSEHGYLRTRCTHRSALAKASLLGTVSQSRGQSSLGRLRAIAAQSIWSR